MCDELSPACPIITKRGEEVLYIIENVTLLEARAPYTQYKGSSHSMSSRSSLPVSNRQRVSGIRVLAQNAYQMDCIHQRIRFGLALHQDRSDGFIQAMRNRLAEMQAETPLPPLPPADSGDRPHSVNR